MGLEPRGVEGSSIDTQLHSGQEVAVRPQGGGQVEEGHEWADRLWESSSSEGEDVEMQEALDALEDWNDSGASCAVQSQWHA